MECEKIQPCPYCGEREMHILKTDHAFGEKVGDNYQVTCCSCGSFGPLHKKLQIAIKLWNVVSDAWYDNHTDQLEAEIYLEEPPELQEVVKLHAEWDGKSPHPYGCDEKDDDADNL